MALLGLDDGVGDVAQALNEAGEVLLVVDGDLDAEGGVVDLLVEGIDVALAGPCAASTSYALARPANGRKSTGTQPESSAVKRRFVRHVAGRQTVAGARTSRWSPRIPEASPGASASA